MLGNRCKEMVYSHCDEMQLIICPFEENAAYNFAVIIPALYCSTVHHNILHQTMIFTISYCTTSHSHNIICFGVHTIQIRYRI